MGLVIYAYLGYPVLLWLNVRLRIRCSTSPPFMDPGTLPRVSILLAAYNEARWLPRRLENLLAAAARGDVLSFTDRDCRPHARWLEEGLAALDRADIVAATSPSWARSGPPCGRC